MTIETIWPFIWFVTEKHIVGFKAGAALHKLKTEQTRLAHQALQFYQQNIWQFFKSKYFSSVVIEEEFLPICTSSKVGVELFFPNVKELSKVFFPQGGPDEQNCWGSWYPA